MKKRIALCFFMLLLFLAGCSMTTVQNEQTNEPLSWQEQYDLGTRYLSEGNYREAIIAFTKAIGIDPKQADAYIGLADAYTGIGDIESAIGALEKGIEAIDETDKLLSKITEIQALSESTLTPDNARKPVDGYPTTKRHDNPNGSYTIIEFDQYGMISSSKYYTSEEQLSSETSYEYDKDGKRVRDKRKWYNDNGHHIVTYYKDYDNQERIVSKSATGDRDDGKSWNEEHRYDYSNPLVAGIHVRLIEDGMILEASQEYTMHAAGSYVEVIGLSWSTGSNGGELKIRELQEYKSLREGPAYNVSFDEEGNMTTESFEN